MSGSFRADPGATRTNVGRAGVLGAGTRLAGRYRIEELAGVGAMGMVYRARDEVLGVDVALKVLRPEVADDPAVRERFRRELVLARQVTHPHVVRIHDLGEDRSEGPGSEGSEGGEGSPRWFLTMDFVPGRSLRQLLDEEGPMPVDRAVELVRQLAEALAAAHRQGVIHRDLKPSNVLVDERAEARITDFGVARSLAPVDGGQPTGADLTRRGGLVGTPEYLSPEQVRGGSLDGRSDLYALGLILFELLSGELPFRGGTLEEVLGQRLAARPRRLRDAGVEAPAGLERVLERCLARDPEDRYPDGEALARDLIACLTGGAPPAEVGGRTGRRRRVWSALAAVAVAGGAVGVWWLFGRSQSASTDRASEPAVTGSTPSVAVLPFADQTGRADLAWASEGIAGLLAEELAESPSLRVVDAARVARTVDAVGFEGGFERGAPLPSEVRQLAGLLDADRLVAGSLRTSDGRLLVDGRLLAVGGTGPRTADLRVEGREEERLAELVKRLSAAVRSGLAVEEPEGPALIPAGVSADALAAYGQGIARLHRGDAVGAAPVLERAVAAHEGFAAAWLGLSRARQALGRHEAALVAARRAVGELPEDAGRLAYGARAQQASLAGDTAAARSILAELVERYPHDAAARVALAEAYGDEGRFPKASELLAGVVEEEPNHPRAWYLLGKYAILSGDSRRAADEYLVRALVIHNRLGNQQGRADALNALGIAFDDLGERAEAAARYREAAELRRKIGDRRGYAASLTNLGVLHFLDGDFREGRARLDEALAILEELGDPAGVADLQNEFGILEEEQGRYAEALEHYRLALAIRRDLGDRRALAESYNNVGFAYYLLGELDNAGVYWQQALDLYREAGNREGVVIATQSMGLLQLVRGRWDAALDAFLGALEESRELDLPRAEAVSLGNLGRIAQYQGRYGAALSSYRQALDRVDELGDARGLAEFGLFRASALLDLGLVDATEEQLAETAQWVAEAGNREQRAQLDRLTAEVARRQGRSSEARAAFEASLEGARASGSRLAELSARLGLARTVVDAGRTEEGSSALRSVAGEAERIGYRVLELAASVDLARGLLDAGRAREAEDRAREALRSAGDHQTRERWRLHALVAEALELRGMQREADEHWRAAGDELSRVLRGLDDLDETMRRAFEALPEVKRIAERAEQRPAA